MTYISEVLEKAAHPPHAQSVLARKSGELMVLHAAREVPHRIEHSSMHRAECACADMTEAGDPLFDDTNGASQLAKRSQVARSAAPPARACRDRRSRPEAAQRSATEIGVSYVPIDEMRQAQHRGGQHLIHKAPRQRIGRRRRDRRAPRGRLSLR
jgi:hypothetical protein